MAEATNERGAVVRARLHTPDGYTLTSSTALEIVRRVLAGDFRPGFQTPSLAYGADFVLQFTDVSRQDLGT